VTLSRTVITFSCSSVVDQVGLPKLEMPLSETE
jgi:hypothetical protein